MFSAPWNYGLGGAAAPAAQTPSAGTPDLLPLALVLDELRAADPRLRVRALGCLGSVAVALGPARVRGELLPFLTEAVDDESDDALCALADALARLLPHVGGAAHASALLPPLEALAGAEESSVRTRAVAALATVIAALPADAVTSAAWPMLYRFGRRDWFTSRAAAAALLPRVYVRLPASGAGIRAGAASGAMEEDGSGNGGSAPATQDSALALFLRLAGDDVPMVRRAASAAFAEMGSAVAGGELPLLPAIPPGADELPAALTAAVAAPVPTAVLTGAAAAEEDGAAVAADLLNVDTGDMAAAAVPPPVPKPVCVSAASPAAGAAAATALLPVLAAWSRDEQDSVRLLAVDACVALARLTNGGMLSVTDGSPAGAAALAAHSEERGRVLELACALAGDRAWRVRWSVCNRLGELGAACGVDAATRRLLPAYEIMLNDAEAEVRTAAAYRVADFGRLVGKDQVIQTLMPSIDRLSTESSEHVRAALAAVILGLAPVLQHDATLTLLLPLFLRLLKDSSPQVRLNIISKLEAINAVIGVRLLSQSLLPAIVELSSDRVWRVRMAIIDFVPLLAAQLGPDFFGTELTNLCMRWLTDSVAAVRDAAATNIRKLAGVFGAAWAETELLPRLRQMEAGAEAVVANEVSPYLLRKACLLATVTLGKIVSPAALVSAVLPVLARLAADPVPNIRFSVAIALETLAPRMDASTRAVVAKPLLASLALDGEADVQHFAMRALAALG